MPHVPHTPLPVALIAAAPLVLCSGCSPAQAPPTQRTNVAPADGQHQGITAPHGDHRPYHGGMVLMNGDVHYEVVFDRGGRHSVWFSDALRTDMPASVARDVRMVVMRPGAPPEELELSIDEAGESWVANGRPVQGENVMVLVTYFMGGTPHEIELPFFIPSPTG